MIQQTFILSSLISLNSPSVMNSLQLTVATKSAVCFSETGLNGVDKDMKIN